jgi:hypothetical protein
VELQFFKEQIYVIFTLYLVNNNPLTNAAFMSLTKESRKIKMPSFNFLEENNVKKYNKINKSQSIQI